jgi:MSHA biogenesis protein MshK
MTLRFVIASLIAVSMADGFAQQLRDPTRPPGVGASRAGFAEAVPSDLVLQTVLVSPERRNAIVNGRLLRVGDSISGMRVIEIRESAVVLRGPGELRTLSLFPLVEKRSGAGRSSAAREAG